MAFDPVYMPLEHVWDVAQLPVLVVARVSVVLQCFLSLSLLDQPTPSRSRLRDGWPIHAAPHEDSAANQRGGEAPRVARRRVFVFLFLFSSFFRVFDDRLTVNHFVGTSLPV